MQAIRVTAERSLDVIDLAPPGDPGPEEVQVRVGAVALNHIDVWGWRGMAFAKQTLPLVAGAEAAGTVVAVGKRVTDLAPGQTIKHLRWHRPVLAGETISFRSWAERKIDLPKHIGWGLLICGAEGIDARGRRVLSFNPQLLLERMSK